MNAKRPLRTLPDTADGRRRVYEYGPGPNIDPDPMAPFDPAALVGPAVDWGDERAAAGWEIARKDVRNLGRVGRVPYQKRPHSDERDGAFIFGLEDEVRHHDSPNTDGCLRAAAPGD